jgi:hypothetical protein
MHPDRTPVMPRRPASKGCPACGTTKPADEFYVSRGRLSSYCKSCQRRISNDAYRRRPRCLTRASIVLGALDPAHRSTAPATDRHRAAPDPGTAPGVRVGTSTPASPSGMWPPCAGWASSTPPAPTFFVLLGRLSPGSPKVTGQLSEQTLRQILTRWEERGLIARDRLLGFQWVAPTVKALRLVGLDVRGWSFVVPQLTHVHAVGVVRLALEPSIPAGGRWLSERELRREAGKSHVPDGAVQLPDDPEAEAGSGLYGEDVDPLPRRVAVEVELTRKGAARLREAWTRPRHGRWTQTAYYAPPEVAGYLSGQLQRIRPHHPIQAQVDPPAPQTATRRCSRPAGAGLRELQRRAAARQHRRSSERLLSSLFAQIRSFELVFGLGLTDDLAAM